MYMYQYIISIKSNCQTYYTDFICKNKFNENRERFDCYYRMLRCFIFQVFLRILKTHWIIHNSVSALLHYMTLEYDVSIELKIN